LELSWSTFVLEIINFLILVWILKRFFYRPVLDVIAKRRGEIDDSLNSAEALHADAEKLRKQYEGRLTDWDQERQQARAALNQELDVERAKKIQQLQTELEQAREKTRVVEARHQAVVRHQMEETALKQAARFASRLLAQAAGAETEANLVDLVTTELSRLPAERIAELRNSYGEAPDTALVVSAQPLSDNQRQQLEQVLMTIVGPELKVQFEQNSELLAGVRISVGAWVLGANLRDELEGFSALAHEE
jgi:F-type H+-transporting ATPase subunit b